MTTNQLKESAAKLRWDIKPFIGGRYQPSTSKESFENINPSDESVLCRVPAGSAEDIDAAVRVARQRFEDGCWSQLPPGRRMEVLLKLADLIAQHADEIALLDSLEMGKPIQAARFDAAGFSVSLLRRAAEFTNKLYGNCTPLSAGTLAFNTYEPRGVVGAITPWNFPAVNAAIKFGPALAAGNTMVLKPSELSPSSAFRLAELAIEAGVPEGVLNIVPGLGATAGAALALHPDVDMLTFTGSTLTGRKIMELSGRSTAKPMLLECGGKSPQVVFADIDNLEAVADATVKSALWNQGQVCSARTRLLVDAKIKEALLERVVQLASEYRPGDPLDEKTTFGPLASPTQRNRVKGYVEQGVKAGAQPVLQGAIQEKGGCFVSPTVFDRVDPSMSIAREEIFGPVLSVMSFKTEEEAIALANATEYGLCATVWTRDMGRAKRLARALRVGSVEVRTSGTEEPASGYSLDYEPQKGSGFGSESGLRGLQSYSNLKSVTFSGA